METPGCGSDEGKVVVFVVLVQTLAFSGASMRFSCSLLVLAAFLPGQAPGTDFVHDFRGGNMPSPNRMVLNGVDKMVEAKPEEGGLRIKVLANRGKAGAGLQTKFSLTGDFEITASYEILSFDKPATGYGVGVYLTISPAAWKNKRATLARCWTPQTGSGFQPVFILAGPVPINRTGWEPSETMKGQLRLRREGDKLFYLINEEVGQPFREILQCDYGTEAVDMVRLVANPGSSPAAVDVRLLDIQMHWGGLPDHARTAPSLGKLAAGQSVEKVGDGRSPERTGIGPGADRVAPGQVPEAQIDPPSRTRLAKPVLLGLATTLFVTLAVGLMLRLRQRPRSPTPKSRVVEETGPSKASSPTAAVACSVCGKRLKIKVEFAGKKIRCPHCSTAVLVPEAGETWFKGQ
jgi:DNA-directed RNA polymerase subunit RPC12/RpoP